MLTLEAAKAWKELGGPQPVRGDGPVPDICPVWIDWGHDGDGMEPSVDDLVYLHFPAEVPYYAAPEDTVALDWIEAHKGWGWMRFSILGDAKWQAYRLVNAETQAAHDGGVDSASALVIAIWEREKGA